MSEPELISSILYLLGSNYRREVNHALINTWADEFAGFNAQVLGEAALDLMRNEEFFPTLHTFSEYVKKASRRSRTQVDRQIEPGSTADCEYSCENGIVWMEGNVTRPCPLHANQQQKDIWQRHDEEWEILTRQIGVNIPANAHDVYRGPKYRSKTQAIRARERILPPEESIFFIRAARAQLLDPKHTFEDPDIDIKDWLAERDLLTDEGQPVPQSEVESRMKRYVEKRDGKYTETRGNVLSGGSLDDFLTAQDAPGSPPAGSDGAKVPTGGSDAAGDDLGGNGGKRATKAPPLPQLPPDDLDRVQTTAEWVEDNF